MRNILIFLGILLLVATASATTWTNAGGCWTATSGSTHVVMWNATGTSTWVAPAGITSLKYLVVAGGGGGGKSPNWGSVSGGGGAGGLLQCASYVPTSTAYTITVGAGAANQTSQLVYGNNGGNSSLLINTTWINATGGGGGATYSGNNYAPYWGRDGGSGGGGASIAAHGHGIAGQGYNGGDTSDVVAEASGGGGAGGVGTTKGTGQGGDGVVSDITLENVLYAVGGNGGQNTTTGGVMATGGYGYGGGGGKGGATTDGGGGSSGVVVIQYDLVTDLPVASFTSNATVGIAPLHVQFNDTSVTDITNWSWDFDEGNTSDIQNPTNIFYNGNHYVTLNVTNATGGSASPAFAWINVSPSGGLTGFNRQDVLMDQIFTISFSVQDSSSHNGIPGAIVSLSNGDNTTTDLFGNANFSMNYSAIVAQFAATGYQSRTISYVVDRDRTETIFLTEQPVTVNTSANTNIVYVPKQVELTVVSYDPAGVVVPGAHVDLTAVANTLQADSQLQTLYGINPEAANQLMNGTLVMHGTTGSDGGIVFTILQSINYRANVTDPATSTVYTATLFPGSDPYTIWIGTNPIKNATPSVQSYLINNTKLYITQPDKGNVTNNLMYQDISGKTTRVDFTVKYANNLTVAYQANSTGFGTNIVYLNYTHRNIRGQGYFFGYNATRVT